MVGGGGGTERMDSGKADLAKEEALTWNCSCNLYTQHEHEEESHFYEFLTAFHDLYSIL